MPESKAARFGVADHVRVKSGTTDSDYRDVFLGGWSGTVVEVKQGDCINCLVRWSNDTLRAMSTFYRSRCEADGRDHAEKWLDQVDLENDDQLFQPSAPRRDALHESLQEEEERWLQEGGR